MNTKYGKDWHQYFVYDPTSPTFLRWKHKRIGRNGSLVNRRNSGVAGSFQKSGAASVVFENHPISVKKVIWEMFNDPLVGNEDVLILDGDGKNLSIENLCLTKDIEFNHKYDKFLGEYLYYCEESPSKLRWKKRYRRSSNITVGGVAGSLDTSDGYWKLHGLGSSFKVHKIVWALFNNFPDQSGKHIDHLNRERGDNTINNLRLVEPILNGRNASLQKSNKMGINGLHRFTGKTKNGVAVDKITATANIGGKRASFSMSVLKWGEEFAEFSCSEWRLSVIDLLNSFGYGYTETHGQSANQEP